MKSYTTIVLDQTAIIVVPNASNIEAVFNLEAVNGIQVRGCTVHGGKIQQSGGNLTNWSAIRLEGTDSGVLFNKFVNIEIFNPQVGIELVANGNSGGWINSNLFQFLKINSPAEAFVKFRMDGPPYQFPPAGIGANQNQTGIHKNSFENLECQCGSIANQPQFGIKDIMNFGNLFFDVKVWDFNGIGTKANVDQHARDTIIVGGMMTDTVQAKFPTPAPETNTLIVDPFMNSTIDTSVNAKLISIEQEHTQYHNII